MKETEDEHLISTQQNNDNGDNDEEEDEDNKSSSGIDENSSSEEKQLPKKNLKKEDEIVFGGRFECKKGLMIGQGTFGEIYLGVDTIQKEYVAVKLEKPTAKQPQLRNEKYILDMMADVEGFPKAFDLGNYMESTYMAMELLGPSTNDLFNYCQHFTLQTVLLIAIQMIERVQELHNKNYIHRDIKPENYTIGTLNKTNTIYLIDFGLCKKYKDTKTMEHIIYRENREITGTPRYASINNHLGIEQSRRDDLEGIAYVLIYFLKRKLPWQNVEGKTVKERYKKILEKKVTIPIEILCKDIPEEFGMMLNYARNLRYDERPDYEFLKGMFTDLLFENYTEDFYFDWAEDRSYNNVKRRTSFIESPQNLRTESKETAMFYIDKEKFRRINSEEKSDETEREKLMEIDQEDKKDVKNDSIEVKNSQKNSVFSSERDDTHTNHDGSQMTGHNRPLVNIIDDEHEDEKEENMITHKFNN